MIRKTGSDRAAEPKTDDDFSTGERSFMRQAIEEARKSLARQRRDDPSSPAVGAVLVDKEGQLLARAHRSGGEPGQHAEFVALGNSLGNRRLPGATLYTTLEPCVHVRSPRKTDCAIRVVDAGIGDVVVGMLDPDERVCAQGWRYLQENGIRLRRFPADLERELWRINERFAEEACNGRRPRPPRPAKKRGVPLRFVDDTNPDPVDVGSLTQRFQRDGTSLPEIHWSGAHQALWSAAIRERTRVVAQLRLRSAPGPGPETSAFEHVERSLETAWKIRSWAAHRVPKMWRGMRAGSWRRGDMADAFALALGSFLKISNAECLCALHQLQRSPGPDLFPPAGTWSDSVRERSGSHSAIYPQLFPAHRKRTFIEVEVARIAGRQVDVCVYAPKDAVLEVWHEAGHAPVRWVPTLYSEFVVPQVELARIRERDTVKYGQMQWKMVRDERGDELNDDPVLRRLSRAQNLMDGVDGSLEPEND